jgi:hypothetical protein
MVLSAPRLRGPASEAGENNKNETMLDIAMMKRPARIICFLLLVV